MVIHPRWNETALECYKRGCVCLGCKYSSDYFTLSGRRCRMKFAVVELVKMLGIPQMDDLQNIR